MKDFIFCVVLYVTIGVYFVNENSQLVEGPQHVKLVFLYFLNPLPYLGIRTSLV